MCIYMQDTWLVGADAGEPVSHVPIRSSRAAGRA
jgi:hypothetical protein